MARNMADKKKAANPSRSAARSQTVNAKAVSSSKESASEAKAVSSSKDAAKDTAKEEKAASSAKEPAKGARAVSRERERSKAAASKPAAKGPTFWQRLRKNRSVRFFLDAYYELRHKVTWPTFLEARNMTIIVILLSAAIGLVLGMVDLGLYQVFLLITRIK